MSRYFIFCAGKDKDEESVRRLTAHALLDVLKKKGLPGPFLILSDEVHCSAGVMGILADEFVPNEERADRCIVSLPLMTTADRQRTSDLLHKLDGEAAYPKANITIVLASAVHCAVFANTLHPTATTRTDFLKVISGGGAVLYDRWGGRFQNLICA